MFEMQQALEKKRIVECYAAAGLVFGTVTLGPDTPAAVLACSAGHSVCAKPSADSNVSSGGICSIM